MPFSRPSFCGASVLKINSNLGLGSQGSSLEVTLVEDPTNGDSFNPGNVGGPVYFSIGAYTFNGILRKWTKERNFGGYPTYTVQVIDPRHLLDACKLITSDYRLSVTGIYNLFNVFGYLENTGYGNSQANDTGMPWRLVRDALITIANATYGSWGGPITYRSTTYSLDLTNLPNSMLPSYFRVGGHGHGMSILDFIQQVCEAANSDFYITLTGTTIGVSVIARVNAYPLGTLANVITSTFANSVVRASDGIEERDETVSLFLIGGSEQRLYKVDPSNAYPFWGFNSAGTILYGSSAQKYAIFYARNFDTATDAYKIYCYPVYQYTLYVPELSSITGSTAYTTNDIELMVLLGLGNGKDSFSSWVQYLRKSNPTLYQVIALTNTPIGLQPPPRIPIAPANVVNAAPANITAIQAAGRGAIFQSGIWRLRLVYEALFKFAKDYYGRKFALNISGISRYTDAETSAISVSHEPSEGGYVASTDVTNDLLGLPTYASDLFQTQDGRYVAYAKFSAANADLSRVNPTNSLIDGNNLYIKGRLHNQVYFDGSSNSFVVMEVDPVYDYPDNVVGMSGLVGALLKATGINIENVAVPITNEGVRFLASMTAAQPGGSIPIISHPAARLPSGYEVPLKSNILTYGPWYAQGATGRIQYEQDNTLVPWNYNGFTGMDNAANAKVTTGISYAQVVEAGYVEAVGIPAYNLGDIITTSGINITGINVGWGKEGVTTTYRFENFVPRFGQISKFSIDRFQRLNMLNLKRANEMKALNRQNTMAVQAEAEGQRTSNMINALFEAVNIRTPRNALVSIMVAGSGNEIVHPIVSTTTYEEALGLIPASGSDYNNTTISTWENIIGPYQVGSLASPAGALVPVQTRPSGVWDDANTANSSTLNHFKASNSGWATRYYLKGEGAYTEDLNDNYIDYDVSGRIKRAFGLRSPLMLIGWGLTISGTQACSGSYLRDYSMSKAGPVDLLWDENRGVWTPHDILNVVIKSDSVANSTVSSTVQVKGSGSFNLTVYSLPGQSTIPSGTYVQVGYVASDNRWYILSGAGSGSSNAGSGITSVNSQTGPAVNHIFTQDVALVGNLGGNSSYPYIIASGNKVFHYLPSGYKIQVTGSDTTPNYLFNKISGGSGITTVLRGSGGNEILEINSRPSGTYVYESNITLNGPSLYTNVIYDRIGSGNNIRTYANAILTGSTYVIKDSNNVLSISPSGVGVANCVFEVPMNTNGYVITTGVSTSSSGTPLITMHGKASNNTKKTTDFNLYFYNLLGDLSNPEELSFAIISGSGGKGTGGTGDKYFYNNAVHGSQIFDSATVWVAPSGVTRVFAEAVGHGGDGSSGSSGKGSGGGAYSADYVEVTSGLTYDINVPTTIPGFTGISLLGTDLIKAESGTYATGGQATNCLGLIKFDGGAGGDCPNEGISGGGGGGGAGASPLGAGAAGEAGDIILGGSGAIGYTFAGSGGRGADNLLGGISSQSGFAPGGGAGGSSAILATSSPGAKGRVVLTW